MLAEESGRQTAGARNPYWPAPFRNHKTNCPYPAGSYERIEWELASRIAACYCAFILDIPPDREELARINEVLTRARREAQNGGVVTAISDQAGGAAS